MLNERIEKMLVEQMNFEISSAYIYLAMGAYLDSCDMPGLANWMKVQWQEEIFHATKMYDYIVDRGGRIVMEGIAAPQDEWGSVLAVFEHALRHEQTVTEKINKLMTAAIEEHDHATRSFLNWYVDEQIEEEANVEGIIKHLKMVKDSGHGMYMLDKELSTRVFVQPSVNK